MISDFTQEQLRALSIPSDRPLVICDVDEVVVHFTRRFEDYLGRSGLWLDLASLALHGNIKDRSSGTPVSLAEVAQLIDSFFVDETGTLEAIDGAVPALQSLGEDSTVVMLTNLPHHARDKRIANLLTHGLRYPVITNSGPKGPAISHLAAQTREAVVFIDDSPNFIQSARDHAPHVHLVHFLHDERYARHVEPFDYVSLMTGTWQEALPHVQKLVRR